MTSRQPTYEPAATILRRHLTSSTSTPLILPGVYDGLTARIALSHGFAALYLTGAGVSASRLGLPDLGLLSLPDVLGVARTVASLSHPIPLLVDVDTGFGGPLNVARTVRAMIEAGVAGVQIEDQVGTKRCGHLRGKELVGRDEFWGRIRAACRARDQVLGVGAGARDLVVVARSDALAVDGFEEAVERLEGAVREGADVVFLEGVVEEEQGRRFCEVMRPTPCMLNVVAGGVTPNFSARDAQRMGYGLVIWPLAALTEVYVGVDRAMRELKQAGSLEAQKDGKGGIRDIFGICGLADCQEFDGAVGGKAYQGDL